MDGGPIQSYAWPYIRSSSCSSRRGTFQRQLPGFRGAGGYFQQVILNCMPVLTFHNNRIVIEKGAQLQWSPDGEPPPFQPGNRWAG